MSQFLTADSLKVFLPLVGGVVGFLYNERLKRRSEEYLRKEERHRKVLSTLRGFYTGAEDWSLKREFANEVAGLPSDERARLDDSLLLGIAEGIAREEWPPMECAITSLEVGYFSGETTPAAVRIAAAAAVRDMCRHPGWEGGEAGTSPPDVA